MLREDPLIAVLFVYYAAYNNTWHTTGVVNFLIGHRYSMNTVPEYTTGSKNRISILYTIIVILIYLSVYCGSRNTRRSGGIALPGRNPINYMKI